MGLPKIAVPEYSLTLPSTGKELKYRPFLVKEEKLLLLAMESEDNKQIVTATKNVLQNCIFDDINVEDMPIFDIEYIFLWLRGRAKGEKLELNYKCPKCEQSLPVDLNLEDIKVTYPEGHEKKVEINDSVGIVLKYPNMAMQAKIETIDSENEVEVLFKSIQLCIDYIYDNETMYSSKDHTEKELEEFIESLTDVQFKKLASFFETMPKLEHKLNLVCTGSVKDGKKKKTNCDYKEEITLEGLQSFFV
jgi:hypothetical protein